MKSSVIARILAAALIFGSFGQASAQDNARNYTDCISRKPTCDANLLTPEQAKAVVRSLLGESAKVQHAPVSELQAVAQAEHDNNLRNCKIGGYCNKSLLVGDEVSAVAQAEHDNNLRNCKIGGYCNKSLLVGDEVSAVAQAEHDNNLRNCKIGGYCNKSLLVGDEVSAVAQAEHDNNLRNCKIGGYCNKSLLVGDESTAPQSTKTPIAAVPSGYQFPIPTTSGPVQFAVPGVAENGSYYGELNANGVPKTVHVNGYYRKDGTYVRGYYRSPPNTNPPRVRVR